MATLGILIGIALTLCVFSFLYRDNPFYTFAEHLFVGLAAGYGIVVQIQDGFIGTIWESLELSINQGKTLETILTLIPALVGLLFFTQFAPNTSWLVRIPFAITIGYGAGIAIPAAVEQDIFKHVHSTIRLNHLQSNIKTGLADSLGQGQPTVELQDRFRQAGLVMTKTAKIKTIKDGAKWQIQDQIQLSIDSEPIISQQLDNTVLPDLLSRGFIDAGYELSSSAKIKVWKKGHRWQVVDGRIFNINTRNGKLVLDESWTYTAKREALPKDKQIEQINIYTDFFHRDGWQIFNLSLIFVGVICTLTYFFFSVEHEGIVGGISKIGVVFIMVGFGAAFGNTVMGRVSLLIGRVQFLIKALPSLFGG